MLDVRFEVGRRWTPARRLRAGIPDLAQRLADGDAVDVGTLQLRLKWASSSISLGLWVNGVLYQPSSTPEVAVSIPVSAGQRVVFVEGLRTTGGGHISFTLETSFAQ